MTVTPEAFQAPVPLPPVPSKTKALLKRILAGVLTAATSSSAIKEEKSLAAIVVSGLLLSLGASYGTVTLISNLITGH